MRIKSSSERSERRSRWWRVRFLLDAGRAICSPTLERRRLEGMLLKMFRNEGKFESMLKA
jgi:hypothetical protein